MDIYTKLRAARQQELQGVAITLQKYMPACGLRESHRHWRCDGVEEETKNAHLPRCALYLSQNLPYRRKSFRRSDRMAGRKESGKGAERRRVPRIEVNFPVAVTCGRRQY